MGVAAPTPPGATPLDAIKSLKAGDTSTKVCQVSHTDHDYSVVAKLQSGPRHIFY